MGNARRLVSSLLERSIGADRNALPNGFSTGQTLPTVAIARETGVFYRGPECSRRPASIFDSLFLLRFIDQCRIGTYRSVNEIIIG